MDLDLHTKKQRQQNRRKQIEYRREGRRQRELRDMPTEGQPWSTASNCMTVHSCGDLQAMLPSVLGNTGLDGAFFVDDYLRSVSSLWDDLPYVNGPHLSK